MKFQIQQFVLEALVAKAAKVMSLRTRDILSNYYIAVENDIIAVTATDLDLALVATSQMVQVDEPGDVLLKGRFIDRLAKIAPTGILTIETTADGHVLITSGDEVEWKSSLIDTKEFPKPPVFDKLSLTQTPRTILLETLSRVLPAACMDGYRPELEVLDLQPTLIRATDGVRLHQVMLEGWGLPFRAFLPVGTTADLIRQLRLGVSDVIGYGQTDKHLIFEIDGDMFIRTKVDVNYPDAGQAMFGSILSNKDTVVVQKDTLLTAIHRVALAADKNTNLLAIDLVIGELRAESIDGVSARHKIELGVNGDPQILAVNYQYLIQLLSALESPTITISYQAGNPILIREGTFYGVLRQLQL